MLTPASVEALKILRDGSLFQWYVIPLFALVVYVYAAEIEKRNWSTALAGLAFWGMDWFNEIWNSLVLHFTQYAPVWGAPGHTAYLILVGLNIEISLMFAIAGIVFVKTLPPDRHMRIAGLPNRLVLSICASVFCVCVEIWLNSVDALTWDYSWWNARAPWLIVVFGYLHFFLVASWVYDMRTIAKKAAIVAAIFGIDIAGLVVFGGMLTWI